MLVSKGTVAAGYYMPMNTSLNLGSKSKNIEKSSWNLFSGKTEFDCTTGYKLQYGASRLYQIESLERP